MARKKVVAEPALRSWADVDNALKLIGEFECCLDEIQIEMQRRQADAKEAADKMGKPYQEKIKKLSQDLCEYVTQNRDELDGKTKQLNFGKTGFRMSTKLMTPKEPGIVAKLKRYKMLDCINTKESVLKEVLRTYPTEDILKTGAYIKSEDGFWYEVEKDVLQPAD